MRKLLSCIFVLLLSGVCTPMAYAWGEKGHYLIKRVAVELLPDDVPGFLHTPEAIAKIGLPAPSGERELNDARASTDALHRPGYDHYIDIGDNGVIANRIPLASLPDTLQKYYLLLSLAGRAGPNGVRTGLLPYEIIEGYERVVTDFAYYRLAVIGVTRATDDTERAYFSKQRKIREDVVVRDIAAWGDFVGDAAQPLRVTVHYNGWGKGYLNPHGYSNSPTIFRRFETALETSLAGETPAAIDADVLTRVHPYVASSDPIQIRVATYLRASLETVRNVYQLENDGAIDNPSPTTVNFMLDRIAAGAEAMRNLIADAWAQSATAKLGRRHVSVSDIESGVAVP